MATTREIREAIKALPGMTAMRDVSGEWRVTVDLYRLSDRYPDEKLPWLEAKQEAMAYYGDDDDALSTAQDMSRRWIAEGLAAGMSEAERAGTALSQLVHGASVALTGDRLLAVEAGQDGQWKVLMTLADGASSGDGGYGSSSEAARAALKAYGSELDADAQDRLWLMTQPQREFVDTLRKECKLGLSAALALEDKLGTLAAVHYKLAKSDVERGLTGAESDLRDTVEQGITGLAAVTQGLKGVRFLYDPRGETVALKFDSGASNSLTGGYKVPVVNEDREAIEDAYERMLSGIESAKRYVSVQIDSTANAAFADGGRDEEAARILREAADLVVDLWGSPGEHALRDLNGNSVGVVRVTEREHSEPVSAELWMTVECSASGDDAGVAAAEYLREAAGMLKGNGEPMPLRDVNGNRVGSVRFSEPQTHELNGRVDMSGALSAGDVYLAEGGFSGIADGEYRYVVVTNDFTPGYHQGSGDAWLVNARGEFAPGYEEPQTVRELDIRALKKAEVDELAAVADGRVAFEAFERQFADGDDPAP